ncbi:MAG: sensor domain-containing diguanylate cyclase, partial [Actinomycetes bacterium]
AELLGADFGDSIYAGSAVYSGGLLAGLAASLLWTFGLVFMVNRRLSADIDTERANLQRIFAISPDATVISRLRDGMVVDVNQGFSRITGYSRQEAVGQFTIAALWVDPEERDTLVQELQSEGSCENLEAGFRRKDGTAITGMISARLLDLHGEQHIISIARDISERKRLEEELQRQASTDFLTGVANRRQFLRETVREIARSQRHRQPLSVALLDIDHFKDINDTYGHSAGDDALVAFVATLRENIRQIDVIGRVGGDEFAVMFPNTDAVQALQSLERCREVLAENPMLIGDGSVLIRFTGGISTLADERDTVDTILARADLALYAAKHEGRDRIAVNDSGAVP